ncbi:restriction system-associated AAA family ATPase [Teredinibacter sp. KSP-S5-2]|uniref:restriction system-associated AAA family ATPase n=1 Tax=Teredinibacter sp. KSP-S5-2 TaxID=3034506 RepID=UPI0029340EB1|nr:restriction system-associated AAA family ATPase [Teredinibacter sp. KSP-S5-2]WNO09405.1 restriction system-associated AAA family ATPase [Teredinibacter sp. KSP-S5-2]
MKLLRLKITDPNGFRSLPCGFEHHFRKVLTLQKELANSQGFAPFVCAGPNGSGKSNLLEVLGAILYHMECLYLENRPKSFTYDEERNPNGFQGSQAIPDGFELEYLIKPVEAIQVNGFAGLARVCIKKTPGQSPQWWLLNQEDSEQPVQLTLSRSESRQLLPEFVLGYSSGENEILSLPFFKMRFIQFDEYWQALSQQLSYFGSPETRMVYLDTSFSQAILLCNLLFQDDATLQPFREDVGIQALTEFRILLRRSIELTPEQLETFASDNDSQPQTLAHIVNNHPALSAEEDALGNTRYRLNLLQLLEGDEKSSLMVSALKRCATLSFEDESTDTLILDYWVNKATKQAFRENFSNDPLVLFQAFQVLLTLNLYTVNKNLKEEIYQSSSNYMSEVIPQLGWDDRVTRIKYLRIKKKNINDTVELKDLSDGEHQLLHSLGLSLLFRNTNSLFLLDEPETHFNPDWRANFISRLRQCFAQDGAANQEMLITTHTPFLISDSKPEKVLVFSKDNSNGFVHIETPTYNTLGASINLITMETFKKQETIGAYAKDRLQHLLSSEFNETDPHQLAQRIIDTLGDSIERSFAIQEVLARSDNLHHQSKDD